MTTRSRTRSEGQQYTHRGTSSDAATMEGEQQLERTTAREEGAEQEEGRGEMHTAAGKRGEWFRSSDDTGMTFVRGATFGPKKVEYSLVDGLRIFEGDIVLGKADDRAADAAGDAPEAASARGLVVHGIGITGEEFRWPRGRVPFEIDAGVPGAIRTVINDAIAHWHANTNIRLVPRRAGDTNFVRFVSQAGCWSYVGMRGGMQEISIGAGCGFGAAVHEIGHAVGLWHEQSREDRGRNIRILWQNIQPGREHNFNQHIADGDDIGDYDFDSIMHYGAFAFSQTGQPTIETIGGQPIGQRNGLSASDLAAVRAMYPQLEPPPQTARLFRYWNGRTADHFYTTDWNELGNGRGGYVYEGVQCYIHPAPATGSTPLFRYWNPRRTDHFYTTNWNELHAGASGYVLEGIQGYVYARRSAETIPLHRYWNARAGDHFYTTAWSELGSGRHGWVYEGIQCYVYASPPAEGDEMLETTERMAGQLAGVNRIAALLPEFGSPLTDFGEMGETDGEPRPDLTPVEFTSTAFGSEGGNGEPTRTTRGRAVTIRVDLDQE